MPFDLLKELDRITETYKLINGIEDERNCFICKKPISDAYYTVNGYDAHAACEVDPDDEPQDRTGSFYPFRR